MPIIIWHFHKISFDDELFIDLCHHLAEVFVLFALKFILSFTNSFSHLYLIDNLSELSHDYESDYSRTLISSLFLSHLMILIMTVQRFLTRRLCKK